MKTKLVLLSADAMSGADLDYLLTLPHAKEVFAHAVYAKKVRSVLPTLTYPCHATMITGCLPERHGIWMNTLFSPGEKRPAWRWERRWNRVQDDLLYAAKRQCLTTASVFWPTTGLHSAVDWLIPEYWPQTRQDTLLKAMERMGSSPEVLTVIERRQGTGRIDQHPSADFFAVSCACDILRTFRPDVMLLHPANIDEAKHRYGTGSPEARQAVEETDRMIGMIAEALEYCGLSEQTNFVLASDHGQRDIRRVLRPNVLLREKGLIRCTADSLADWDAYCQAEGMFALIQLRDRSDVSAGKKVLSVLETAGLDQMGVSRILAAEQMSVPGLPADYDFALLSDGDTAFSSALFGELCQSESHAGQKATHGYPPEIGPGPVFIAAGPGFRENSVIEEMSLTDIAPTLAALFGAEMPEAQGEIIREMLQ